MVGNFHNNSFDVATNLKLDIYRSYITEWLPVWLKRAPDNNWNGQINIFDFFCGPGKDPDGQEGSPLIAIKECHKYIDLLEDSNRTINIFFNDARPSKIKQLEKNLSEIEIHPRINIELSSENFAIAFMKKMRQISGAANLIFMDQCGVKEITERVFTTLVGLRGTDFLFFIASSFFKRFKDSDEFKKYLDVSTHIGDDTPYYDIHRSIAGYYRSLIPHGNQYYLAPFSLKKQANLYGLIFGTSHQLGILKFLEICWNIDKERGEANFDIDNDQLPKSGDTLDLFSDNDKATKVTDFQETLETKIKNGRFSSDKDIFNYALENGFVPTRHAKEVVVKLKKEGSISFEGGQPRLSKACINAPRAIRLNSA